MSRSPSVLKLPIVCILAVLPVLAAQAGPQSRDSGDQRGRPEARPESRSSLSEAVRRVERDTRGEVLSAERVQYDGRDMHRVKVVDDQGRVRVFMQDPQQRRSSPGGSPAPRRKPPARGNDD